jgi:hypothetical protein
MRWNVAGSGRPVHRALSGWLFRSYVLASGASVLALDQIVIAAKNGNLLRPGD